MPRLRRGSSRRSRRSPLGLQIRPIHLFPRNPQRLRQSSLDLVGEGDLTAFDARDRRGRQPAHFAELGLGKADQASIVTEKALLRIRDDDVADLDVQRLRGSGQEIYLRRHGADLSVADGRGGRVRQAGDIATGHPSCLPGSCECVFTEAAQDVAAHRIGPSIARHHAATLLICHPDWLLDLSPRLTGIAANVPPPKSRGKPFCSAVGASQSRSRPTVPVRPPTLSTRPL